MSDVADILYEHPLNEHIRTYLRLENLFVIQQTLFQQDSSASHIAALHNLWEILDCLDRGDIKAELLKELKKKKNHFTHLQDSPYIDSMKLRKFIEQLEQLLQWVGQYPGKFGSKLRKDRFIELIRNRIRIPGGSSSFDLPELHQFLHQPYKSRRKQFEQWFSHFQGLSQCIKILLRLFRENSPFEEVVAEKGSLQYHFDKKQNPQLVRIKLPSDCKAFPEVSGSKICFTILFKILYIFAQSENILILGAKSHIKKMNI